MSWGFFCDVEVSLPKADFARVWKSKTDDHALPSPVFGFRSASLEETFTICRDHEDRQPNVALKDLPKWFASYAGRSDTREVGGATTFRGTMILDRGADPWIAKTVAAFLHGARSTGAGHLLLVNDGSYSGEGGVLLALAEGEITPSRLTDSRPLADILGRALFEGAELPTAAELLALARGTKPSKPSKLSKAAKPATASKAAKPATASKAAKPATASKAAKPATASKAAKPTKPTNPTKPTKPTK